MVDTSIWQSPLSVISALLCVLRGLARDGFRFVVDANPVPALLRVSMRLATRCVAEREMNLVASSKHCRCLFQHSQAFVGAGRCVRQMGQAAGASDEISGLVIGHLAHICDAPGNPLAVAVVIVLADVKHRRIEADDVDGRRKQLIPLHIAARMHSACHREAIENRLPQTNEVEADIAQSRLIEKQNDLLSLQTI